MGDWNQENMEALMGDESRIAEAARRLRMGEDSGAEVPLQSSRASVLAGGRVASMTLDEIKRAYPRSTYMGMLTTPEYGVTPYVANSQWYMDERVTPPIDIARLSDNIVNAPPDAALYPLLLFAGRGQSQMGRYRALFNYTVTLMDIEARSILGAARTTAERPDVTHMLGLHHFLLQANFRGFFGRLLASPSVLALAPGLEEYVHWLIEESGFKHIGGLVPLAPTSPWSKQAWRYERRLSAPRFTDEMPEHWPFVAKDQEALTWTGYEMVKAVDALVPRGIPEGVRQDLCQDLIVAVLSGETTIENLRADLPKFTSNAWKQSPAKYGEVSIDMVLKGTNDLLLRDVLVAPDVFA